MTRYTLPLALAIGLLLGGTLSVYTQDGVNAIANLRGKVDENFALLVNPGTPDVNVVNVPSVSVANLVPTSAPTYAVSPCTIVTTASTNATQCADAPANFYGVYYAINTTTTSAFMRVIDDASSITCTDTPTFVVPIPAASAAGVYGGVVIPMINPIAFSNGVAVCVTSGSDGTGNAPAGIIILNGVKE